jgi:hypothetical protein
MLHVSSVLPPWRAPIPTRWPESRSGHGDGEEKTCPLPGNEPSHFTDQSQLSSIETERLEASERFVDYFIALFQL